mgnify:CR=1 FL=1
MIPGVNPKMLKQAMKKMGVKPASRVLLLGAPSDFEELLGEAGTSLNIKRSARGQGDVVLQSRVQKHWVCASSVQTQ